VLFFRHTIDELDKLTGNCHAAADAALEAEGGSASKAPEADVAVGEPAHPTSVASATDEPGR
jgi:hypothetical protein